MQKFVNTYDPDVAVFLTPDPLGIGAGLNQYAYPSDPFLDADPLGLLIEYYDQDSQGRATGAYAELGPSDVKAPGTPRGPVDVDPPGLNTAHPDHHERSHLIADRLGGDGTDARNIVPLTDGTNGDASGAPGMRHHEGVIAEHLRNGGTVTMEVTPHYNGTDPVPTHVNIVALDQHGNTLVNQDIPNGQLKRHTAAGCC